MVTGRTSGFLALLDRFKTAIWFPSTSGQMPCDSGTLRNAFAIPPCMNALPLLWRLLPLALGLVAAAALAEDPTPPTEAQLRAGAAKGIQFLAKEADTWMNE